jgi:hypothetical protein
MLNNLLPQRAIPYPSGTLSERDSFASRAVAKASFLNPTILTVAELVAIAILVVDNSVGIDAQLAACYQGNRAIGSGYC